MLDLVVQRQLQVVGPDEEAALGVADLHRVVGDQTTLVAHRKLVEREGLGRGTEQLGAPFAAVAVAGRQQIRQLRPVEGGTAGIGHRLAAGQRPPTALGIAVQHAVVPHHGAAVDHLHQVGAGRAVHGHLGALGGRPQLLKLPVRAAGGSLGQHRLQRGPRHRRTIGAQHRRAAGQRPPTARGVFLVNALIEQLAIRAQQHRRQLAALWQRVGPGLEHRLRLRPQQRDVAHRHRCRHAVQHGVERQVVGRCSGQLGEFAVALGVDARRPARHAVVTAVQRLDRVAVEHQLRHLAAAAVGPGETAFGNEGIAVGHRQVDHRVAGAQAGDAGLDQGLQLTRIGPAILVQIAPEAQRVEAGVGGVDHAVGVVVQRGQHRKARHAGRAEQLMDVVDAAVAVDIACQQPVVGAHPAGALGKPVAVQVELNAEVTLRGLDAVAVEVEHQRVVAGVPVQALGEDLQRLQLRHQEAPDRVPQRDLVALAVDPEGHAQRAQVADHELVLGRAELEVVDHHRGVQQIVAGQAVGVAPADDQLVGRAVAVAHEGQQPVDDEVGLAVLHAPAAGERNAEHLQPVMLLGIHDEGAGRPPEHVLPTALAVDRVAVELALVAPVEDEVAPGAADGDAAIAADDHHPVFALAAVHFQPQVAGRGGAVGVGGVQRLAAEHIACVAHDQHVVAGAALDLAEVRIGVTCGPAGDGTDELVDRPVPQHVVVGRQHHVLGACDPQPVVGGEGREHRRGRHRQADGGPDQLADQLQVAHAGERPVVAVSGLGGAVDGDDGLAGAGI